MAVHTKFANLAERLIAKHGRDMTIKKDSRAPADPSKPWRGPNPNPLTGYADSADVKGVMVGFEDAEIDGDYIKRTDKKLLVACKPIDAKDLTTFDTLFDESQVYGIKLMEVIKPGTTKIMYQFRARQ